MASDTVVSDVMRTYDQWVSPRKVNKINWRNLSDDLQARISGIAVDGNSANILSNYFRKTDIIPEENIAQDFRDKVTGINQDLQDYKSVVEETYRKKTDPVDWGDLEYDVGISLDSLVGYTPNKLGSTLVGIVNFINHIKNTTDGNPLVTFNEYGYKQIVIEYGGNNYHVTVPTWSSNANDDAVEIAALSRRLFTAETQVTALKDQVKSLQKLTEQLITQVNGLAPEDISENIVTKIDFDAWKEQIEGRFESVNNSLRNKRANDVAISEDSLSQALKNKINNGTSETTVVSTELQLEDTGYLYNTEDGTIGARDLMIKAYCCNTAEETAAAQAEKQPFIINLTTGIGLKLISDLGTYKTDIQVIGSQDYDRTFIYDLSQDCLAYYINGTSYYKINKDAVMVSQSTNTSDESTGTTVISPQISLQTAEVEIAGGGFSEKITRQNNLKKLAPTILILDSNTSSDTEDKWINSEGMITVANEEDGFKIYNHASISLTCKIIYQS